MKATNLNISLPSYEEVVRPDSFQQTVDERHEALLRKMRELPQEGEVVSHEGKSFRVFPNVLPPYPDSKPIINCLKSRRAEFVLDVGTGSGVLAVFSASLGAKKVVAVDINPAAIRNAQHNAVQHGLENIIDVRLSDVFAAIKPNETFDLITANLPFRNKEANDDASVAIWDTNFRAHRQLLANLPKVLKPKGSLLLSQASFGDLETLKLLCQEHALQWEIINSMSVEGSNTTYYCFEISVPI